MTFIILFVFGVVLALGVMLLTWKISVRVKNSGIVDASWSATFALLACFYAVTCEGYETRKWLITVMVVVWSLRLALYIYFRRIAGVTEEEPRYRELREKWGDQAEKKMFSFFMLQGSVAAFFSIPFLVINMNKASWLSSMEWVGLMIWMIAVTGEALSDYQLDRFKSESRNRGKTCRDGLWKYSRHPNYFFEWLIWCAYFIFALGSPHGWATVIFPALMFHFLWNVTGIPLAEKQALKSRGDDYRQYQKTTSAFIPWFPKKVN